MRGAFTLIEMLVAGALLSTLMTATWFSFSSVRMTMADERATFEVHRRAQVAARRLELLLAEASPYRQPVPDAAFTGTKDSVAFVSLRSEVAEGPPVHVTVERREPGGLVIVRRSLRWLVEDADEPMTVEPLAGATGAVFSYRAPRSEEWVDEWDADRHRGALPELIRIHLTLEDGMGRPLSVPLMARPRLERDPSIP